MSPVDTRWSDMFVITYAKTTEAMKVAKISDCKKYIEGGRGLVSFLSGASLLLPY